MDHDQANADPGWGRPREIILSALVPRLTMRRSHPNGLVAMRATFIGFSAMVGLVGVAAAVITISPPFAEPPGVLPASALVALIGVASVAASRTVVGDLACGSVDELATSFRTRFYGRLAFSMSQSLVGFTTVMVTGSAVP